jgi:hypothetical protein
LEKSQKHDSLKGLSSRIVEKIDLPNNLVLEIYDYSRLVAGDRWLVKLLARIPIKISEKDFADKYQGLYKDFLEDQGPEIYFELKKERNFADDREKDKIFDQMLNELKEYALYYMGHKSFARRFIRRQIQSFEERQKWL